MNEQRIDQVIQALEHDDLELAAQLVRTATGATLKQAREIALTLLEGMEDAVSRGLAF